MRSGGRVVALAVTLALAGCGAHSSPAAVTAQWHAVTQPGTGDVDVASLLAGDPTHPWLLGGDTVASDGTRSVAIWSATTPPGPWLPASFTPASMDAPYDIILGVGRTADGAVAFGSRASPLHGNPRPSVWIGATNKDWTETPTLRELFGGENIIGLGDLTGGPHGFSLAGTWISAANREVATIWRSTDGTRWQRDDSDLALAGAPGEITSAFDVADSPTGLVAVGDALDPTHANPGRQRGAIWWSRDGNRWRREAAADSSLSGPDQTTVQVVTAVPGGWLTAGTRTGAGGTKAMVWSSPDGQHWTSTGLPLPAAAALEITGAAATGTWRFVAGVANHEPVLWASSQHGPWRVVGLPALAAPGDLRAALVAADDATVLVVIRGDVRSTVAWAPWPPVGP